MWRPRSLRVRYTLRALFVFITLLMLWGGYHTNRSWKERAAEDILRRNGSSHVKCGPVRSGKSFVSEIRFAYQQVVHVLWRERFITELHINSSPKAEVIDAIVLLPHLESLTFNPPPLTTEERELFIHHRQLVAKHGFPAGAFDRILAQRKLKVLCLSTWILSDEECNAIARQQSLEHLNLFGSSLPDQGLARILTLPRLKKLILSHCPVEGTTLGAIPGSSSLSSVDCTFAPVGKEFAAFIARSPSVNSLTTHSDTIDDDFVIALGSHASLTELSLVSPKLTDRSVLAVQQMPALKYITMGSGTIDRECITTAAKNRLRVARPGLKVHFQPSTSKGG